MGLIRRTLGPVALAAVAVALGLVTTAPAASADTTVPVNATVTATTNLSHLATAGLTVSVPPGTFHGSGDATTGAFSGNLSLPPATITLTLPGVAPLVDATFKLSPVGPVTGQVNRSSLTVTSTATFNIHLSDVSPQGTKVNLVGSRSATSKPISMPMSGAFSLTAGTTFTGSYTVPAFAHCEALTPEINALLAGSGNTFTAAFTTPGGTSPTSTAPASPSLTPSSVGATFSGSATVTAGSAQVNGSASGGATASSPASSPAPSPGSSSGGSGQFAFLLTG